MGLYNLEGKSMETCPACLYHSKSENEFISIIGPFYRLIEQENNTHNIVELKLIACHKCGCVKMVHN